LEDFFDVQGLVHYEFSSEGRTINKETYVEILRYFKDEVIIKSPEKNIRSNSTLQHNNAPEHYSVVVKYHAKNTVVTQGQSPFSTDLSLTDIFLGVGVLLAADSQSTSSSRYRASLSEP
jgi:hypothetical protein